MTRLGQNVKITTARANRDAWRKVFTDAMPCDERKEPMPDFDVFVVGGANVGVHYVDNALSPEQASLGTWLEFVVTDADAATARLERQGLKRVPYHDGRVYFCGPGGVVFRVTE